MKPQLAFILVYNSFYRFPTFQSFTKELFIADKPHSLKKNVVLRVHLVNQQIHEEGVLLVAVVDGFVGERSFHDACDVLVLTGLLDFKFFDNLSYGFYLLRRLLRFPRLLLLFL